MPENNWFDSQPSSNGGAAGPRAQGSIFLPVAAGLVFKDSNGLYWQLRLAQNADGSTFIGSDSKPTIELIQVTI